MSEQPTKEIVEKKIKVAIRRPPGDRWSPVATPDVILDSLTEVLEYVYQKSGNTQFFMDAKEGITYIVDSEERIIEPTPVAPPKQWSLYGEE